MKILYQTVMSRRGSARHQARGDASAIKAGMDPRQAVRLAVQSARRALGK
jgi:hypothetical protein